MIEFALTIATGGFALVGLVAIVVAVAARSARLNNTALRTSQVSLTAAGALSMISYFVTGDTAGLFGGLLLIVFGTGMTAIRRRSDPSV
jgi:tellurite resistance protein TehA-like permease